MTLDNPVPAGAAVIALAYARALRAHGHEVHLVHGPARLGPSSGGESVVGAFEALGCTARQTVPFSARHLVRSVVVVARQIRRHRADVVIGTMLTDRYAAALAGLITRRRRVAVIQCATDFPKYAAPRLKEAVYAWLLRRSHRVIAVAPHVGAQAVERHHVPAERVSVVLNGIDLAEVDRRVQSGDRTPTDLGGAPGGELFVAVARITPHKGQHRLLDALATLADHPTPWHLAIIGEHELERGSDYAAEVRAQVTRLGLDRRVSFLGWRSDVPELLAAADTFVMPSEREGWSLALVEAMVAGLTMVITDCAGRPDGFVDGLHGWIVASGDTAALREGLRQRLDMPADAVAASRAAVTALAAQYDVTTMGERFVELIEQAAR